MKHDLQYLFFCYNLITLILARLVKSKAEEELECGDENGEQVVQQTQTVVLIC